MVERLDPHGVSEEPLLLGGDAFIHPLHGEADAVEEVTKSFRDINDPPSSLDHRIEAHVPFRKSLFPRIRYYTPLLDFDGSITTFIRLLPFPLLLILSGLFPYILLRWKR